jgi:hypothetical protein
MTAAQVAVAFLGVIALALLVDFAFWMWEWRELQRNDRAEPDAISDLDDYLMTHAGRMSIEDHAMGEAIIQSEDSRRAIEK